MENEARQFARRVVMIHLALLLLVVLIVIGAAWIMYRSARTQAIAQAKHTQELLAKQTALGVENYYESVTAVLNLLQPQDSIVATQPTTDRSSAALLENRPPPGAKFSPEAADERKRLIEKGPLARLAGGLGDSIWASIRAKASALFVVDPVEHLSVLLVIGTSSEAPSPEQIIPTAGTWLDSLRQPSISPFLRIGEHRDGLHVVAVPLRGHGDLLLVAVVPVSRLEQDVLQYVNRSSNTGVMLIDDTGMFISAARREVLGHNLSELNDPRTRSVAQRYMATHQPDTQVFDRAERLGDLTFSPGMSTVQPINVLGRTWGLVVSSGFDEVDKFVKPVFGNMVIWAIFVIVAVGGLLVSTAFQLIRGQMRLERMQRVVLAKEVADAREIQLKWLPKGACATTGVQISAINQPATHISGDFYNWFELDDGRIVVTIGDVTGHGMAAAFLMATTQLLVRVIMPRVKDPGACLQQINKQLMTQTFSGQFVTLLILVLDPARCCMEVATAGHPAPITGTDGAFESLHVEPQLVLGVEPDLEYSSQRFDVSPGQSFMLYTDGAIELQRPDGERFSAEGLAASLHGQFADAKSLLAAAEAAVVEFRAGRDLADDLTLVAIQLETTPATLEKAAATPVAGA